MIGRFQRTHDQRGVTIVELMIAVLVFGFVASGIAVAMGTGLNTIRNNKNRSVAANLAAAHMDKLRTVALKEFESLAEGQTVDVQAVDSIDYTITQDSEWVPQDSSTSACNSPSGSIPAYLRVTLRVTWPNMSGARAVRSETLLSPPVGAYDPDTGHIAVKVIGADGQPQSGYPVTINGPSGSQTLNTTSEGCAFFAYLDEGNYNVSVNKSGNVDRQGVPTPTQTGGVTVGTTRALQFDYDEAATINLTLPQDPSYVLPDNIEDMPLTIANPGLLPLGTIERPITGVNTTITDLFPYTSGYEIWAGDCLDNDPQSHGGERLSVPVTPGGTSDATLPMKLVDFSVVDSTGAPQGGIWGIGVHASDSSCGGGYSINMALTPPADPKVAKVAMPYGTWDFYSGPPGSWGPVATLLDPNAADPTTVVVSQ